MINKIQITLVTIMAFALMFAIMPLALAEDNASAPVFYNLSGPQCAYPATCGSVNETPTLYTENDSNSTSNGIENELEMNDSASGGAVLGQQLKIWFTLNKEKKMEAELKLARLRLIQANIAAKNNNSEAMEKAMEAHERIMNKINATMNKLESNSDFKGLNRSAISLAAMERAIQVHQLRVEHLQNVLENANLTAEQKARIESKLEKAQNNTAHLIEVSENKKDNIKTKLMAVRNLTEEQADAIMEQKQEKMNKQLENRIEKQKQIAENLREERKQARERIKENRNLSDDPNETESEED